MKADLAKLYKMLLSDKWYVYTLQTKSDGLAIMLGNKKILDKYSADCDGHVFRFRFKEDGRLDILSGPSNYNIIGFFA